MHLGPLCMQLRAPISFFLVFGANSSPKGVLRTSSDGDDRRIFLGLKFSIPGFFWV